MSDHLLKIIKAIENCEGCLVPYPTAKKMANLCDELRVIVDSEAQPKDSAGKKKRRPCSIPHDCLYYGTKCPECGR